MFGIERLAEEISALRVEVASLRADVNTMLFRDAVGIARATEEPKADPAVERINRMFTEGLDAVFSYDGKAKSHGEVKEDAD